MTVGNYVHHTPDGDVSEVGYPLEIRLRLEGFNPSHHDHALAGRTLRDSFAALGATVNVTARAIVDELPEGWIAAHIVFVGTPPAPETLDKLATALRNKGYDATTRVFAVCSGCGSVSNMAAELGTDEEGEVAWLIDGQPRGWLSDWLCNNHPNVRCGGCGEFYRIYETETPSPLAQRVRCISCRKTVWEGAPGAPTVTPVVVRDKLRRSWPPLNDAAFVSIEPI